MEGDIISLIVVSGVFGIIGTFDVSGIFDIDTSVQRCRICSIFKYHSKLGKGVDLDLGQNIFKEEISLLRLTQTLVGSSRLDFCCGFHTSNGKFKSLVTR